MPVLQSDGHWKYVSTLSSGRTRGIYISSYHNNIWPIISSEINESFQGEQKTPYTYLQESSSVHQFTIPLATLLQPVVLVSLFLFCYHAFSGYQMSNPSSTSLSPPFIFCSIFQNADYRIHFIQQRKYISHIRRFLADNILYQMLINKRKIIPSEELTFSSEYSKLIHQMKDTYNGTAGNLQLYLWRTIRNINQFITNLSQ